MTSPRRSGNASPWDIGARHYDQRDLYTKNARIDDAGYGRGPSVHPEVGSFAYPRPEPKEEAAGPPELSRIYEREAWPWTLYFDQEAKEDDETLEDERLHAEVHRALTFQEELDARRIHIAVRRGEVTLRGSVQDWHGKRLAVRVARSCPGVGRVRDELEIHRDDDHDDTRSDALAIPIRPM